MVKKLFALASVTALTGLIAAVAVAGCSSTNTVTDPGAETSVTDAKVEAAVKKDAEPEDSSTTTTCPDMSKAFTAADIGLTWIAPGAPQSVCDQSNLDALKAVFAAGKGSAKYSDIEKSLGATCAACVFTPVKGARWGVIVKDGTTIAGNNSAGSCNAQYQGDACGKAAFEADACAVIACPQQECTDRAACQKKAFAAKGPCSTFAAGYRSACTKDIGDVCDNFIKTIVASCGGGGDAGLDASL